MCDYTKTLELCTTWVIYDGVRTRPQVVFKNVSQVPSLPYSLAHGITPKLCPQPMRPDGTWPSTHSPHLPPCFLAPQPLVQTPQHIPATGPLHILCPLPQNTCRASSLSTVTS